MADFFWFSDEQRARFEPLLPQDTRGMPRVNDHRVLPGIVYALKSRGRWDNCSDHIYGPKKTLYSRFRRWAKRRVWERIFADLAGIDSAAAKLFIDSSRIRFHRTADSAKEGLVSRYRHDQRRKEQRAPPFQQSILPAYGPVSDNCAGRPAHNFPSKTSTKTITSMRPSPPPP